MDTVIVLSCGDATAEIDTVGARLKKFTVDETQLLWDCRDEKNEFKMTTLFPWICGCSGDSYRHDGKKYVADGHGFCQYRAFRVSERTASNAVLVCSSDEETLCKYPFTFELSVSFRLVGHALDIAYFVTNCGENDMYFKFGFHPWFNCFEGGTLTGYRLNFERSENDDVYRIADHYGALRPDPVRLNGGEAAAVLPLSKQLFYENVLVKKNIRSKIVELEHAESGKKAVMQFDGFDNFAVWSDNVDENCFVAIEPWCGCCEESAAPDSIENKADCKTLRGGEKRTFAINISYHG